MRKPKIRKLKEIPPDSSEFGKGLTYCIGLFLMHTERNMGWAKGEEKERKMEVELWFNAASDHLYDLNVPDSFPQELNQRIMDFKKKVLHFGHGFEKPFPTTNDKDWAVKEAKEILMLIDMQIGAKVCQGGYE